ncbi:MAG: DUF2505 domain-containing protein [Kofleriaceae bacterium]
MATEFSYESIFRAASTQTVLSAYFDPDHLATQDRLAKLADRVVLEDKDDGATKKVTWRVVNVNPLPLFVRPFVEGGRLSYLETMTWRRADDAIDLTVIPEILGGRVSIEAVYKLVQIAEGQIKRSYKGAITVNVRLLSGKIERGILAKFEEAMPMMTECTQGWLDKSKAS